MKTKLHLLLCALVFFSCQNESSKIEQVTASFASKVKEIIPVKEYATFERTNCVKRIKEKIQQKEPLVIHLNVALCDNENQGIVKVNKNLGNGLNLQTNLYWGAKYGVKNFFKKYSDWQLIESQKNINSNILERLIFYKTFPNSAKVYLVADAYRGDKMKVCLENFFESIAGKKVNNIQINNLSIGINGNADLLLFNGHNGMIDGYNIGFYENEDKKVREVAVMGCVSQSYFEEHLKRAKGYPLLMTTNLMAPEAYILEALVNNWALQKDGTEIRTEVGKAYHQYQQCGIKGATRLFATGWQ